MKETPGENSSFSVHRARLWRGAKRVVLTAPVVILIASYLLAYLFVHPPRWKPSRTPESVGVAYEEVTFRSMDGVRLAGWFAPAQDARAVVILCHGFPASRREVLNHLAFLHKAGFSVFTFDFRALGESDGDISTIGYLEVNDLLGAVRILRERPDTKPLRIGVLGLSMGAAVSIMGAAREEEIAAVVADSSYASLDRAVNQRFRTFLGPLAPLIAVPTRFFGERMTGMNVADASPLKEVARISPRPLLLIHGTRDFFIKSEDSEMLYRAASEPKQLWLVEGARHNKSYRVAGKEYEMRVTDFFEKALTTGEEKTTE